MSENLREIGHKFLLVTTFDGLSQIAFTRHKFLVTIWTTIFFLATTAMITHCSLLIKNYLSYPTNVRMVLKYAETQDFPAVTVCNLNPAPKSRLLCLIPDFAATDEHMTRKKF